MSVRVCVDEHFTSTSLATTLSAGSLPRLVVQQRQESAHDGDIQQLSDPVTMIDTTLRWRNDTSVPQRVMAEVYMASRSFVVSNPNGIEVSDQYGVSVGDTTSRPALQNSLGDALFRSRVNDFRAPSMTYQSTFDDRPGGSVWLCMDRPIGPGREVAVRYVCTVATPGSWRQPKEQNMSVKVNYARLALFAALAVGS